MPPVLGNQSRLGRSSSTVINAARRSSRGTPPQPDPGQHPHLPTGEARSRSPTPAAASLRRGCSGSRAFYTTKPVGGRDRARLSICQRMWWRSAAGRGRQHAGAAAPSPSPCRRRPPRSPRRRRRPRRPRRPDAARSWYRRRSADRPRIRRFLSNKHDVTSPPAAARGSSGSAAARGLRPDPVRHDDAGDDGIDVHRELERFEPDAGARIVFMTGGAFAPAPRRPDQSGIRKIDSPSMARCCASWSQADRRRVRRHHHPEPRQELRDPARSSTACRSRSTTATGSPSSAVNGAGKSTCSRSSRGHQRRRGRRRAWAPGAAGCRRVRRAGAADRSGAHRRRDAARGLRAHAGAIARSSRSDAEIGADRPRARRPPLEAQAAPHERVAALGGWDQTTRSSPGGGAVDSTRRSA